MSNKVNLFIFRRDLRITDNHQLAQLKGKHNILPIFIFNSNQISPKNNEYFGHPSVQFMIESLHSLCNDLPALRFFHASDDIVVLKEIHKTSGIESISFNSDVTPFAVQRDAAINEWAKLNSIPVHTSFIDYFLIDPSTMEKPYQVFTPFYNKYLRISEIKKPLVVRNIPSANVYKGKGSFPHEIAVKDIDDYYKVQGAATNDITGGRKEGLRILAQIKARKFQKYGQTRDFPALDRGTTRLSAYLKYGCVSIREAYFSISNVYGKKHDLIRQLYWRMFYDQITYHFPHVLQGKSMRPKYDKIRWKNNKSFIDAWSSGNTGFPFVDAGMRQLITTGYMHNRLRMVCASFLIKDLQCDWRIGERFFAQHLIDYYPSANNGGWQWCSGSGADSQQYNRVFNPWLQSEKFDKLGVYIKKYIPQLANVPVDHIHNWYKYHDQHKDIDYPSPIVDHSARVKQYIALVKAIY